MNKFLLGGLCLLLSGCSSKLDNCLAEAEKRFIQEGEKGAGVSNWEQTGCLKPGALWATCSEAAAAKRQRILDEDRCVKLYK